MLFALMASFILSVSAVFPLRVVCCRVCVRGGGYLFYYVALDTGIVGMVDNAFV